MDFSETDEIIIKINNFLEENKNEILQYRIYIFMDNTVERTFFTADQEKIYGTQLTELIYDVNNNAVISMQRYS